MRRSFRLTISGVLILFFGGCDDGKPHNSLKPQTTRFTRHGPKAVFLAGQFNDWSPIATPMRRDGSDRWVVDLSLSPGTYQYKFVVDGQWEQDTANPDKAPDGFDGFNSVVTVLPGASPAERSPQPVTGPTPLAIRPEARWHWIEYPSVDIPGVPGRAISARLSPGREGDGRPDEVLFRLIFYQPAGEQIPPPLAKPETFVVRLHLADGSVIDGKSVPAKSWDGAGNQMGMTMSRLYEFPWGRNAFDECWIEWRWAVGTYWFEIPYGFIRNPAEPWPSPDPTRSEPQLAAAMENLGDGDKLVSWRFVEYQIGEIQNHWRLTARMANPFRPAAEIVLYHQPDEGGLPWTAEKPQVNVQIKGQGEGWRVAYRTQGMLDRIDTFRVSCCASDAGRDTGVAIIHVDDRSYEFTLPSSLLKYVHGRADYENKHRLPPPHELFEELLKASD